MTCHVVVAGHHLHNPSPICSAGAAHTDRQGFPSLSLQPVCREGNHSSKSRLLWPYLVPQAARDSMRLKASLTQLILCLQERHGSRSCSDQLHGLHPLPLISGLHWMKELRLMLKGFLASISNQGMSTQGCLPLALSLCLPPYAYTHSCHPHSHNTAPFAEL